MVVTKPPRDEFDLKNGRECNKYELLRFDIIKGLLYSEIEKSVTTKIELSLTQRSQEVFC